MTIPNGGNWKQSHMYLLAIARWDTDGGAIPSHSTPGSIARALHDAVPKPVKLDGRKDVPSVPIVSGIEHSAPPSRRSSAR